MQRVALAMAFLPRPKVLVLDEPTTGLDVTTQGMVLQTMGELCRSHRVAALYVTHDLAVVANIADRVAVMYAGQIIELGPAGGDVPPARAPLHAGAAGRDPAPVARPARSPASRARRRGRGGARPPAGSTPAASTSRTAAGRSSPSDVQVGPDHTAKCLRVGEIGTWDINRGNTTDADPHTARDIILTHRRPQGLLRPQGGRARRHASTWPRPRWSRWSASPAAARPRSRAASAACTSSGPAS